MNGLDKDTLWSHRWLWVAISAAIALALFLSTLQLGVNGSRHAYAADVGEIQNALPRWGLIHRSGYPLYTVAGSLFVAVLRPIGIEPAIGVSLFSALLGVATVALLVVLAQELGAPGPAAAVGAVLLALSTSMWVDASVAEVHTLTLLFTAATLLSAVRFSRTASRRDLLLLTFAFTQGVMHQRTVALLAPTVAVLIWPQLPVLWKNLLPVVGVAVLAPLTYLYMPLRVWTGATWVFGSPGTWDGFWAMVFDNRAGRVASGYGGIEEWRMRSSAALSILADDMLWPLLATGLAAWVIRIRRRDGLAMTLTWIVNLLLVFVIWEGQVSDALLASKLPVVMLAGLGWALLLGWLWDKGRVLGLAATAVLALVLAGWGWHTRPFVLSITRDPYGEAVIAKAQKLYPLPEDELTTLAVMWGHDYWALAYAQECRDQLQGLNLVDHNADLRTISTEGRMLTLEGTLHVFPVSWWEEQLGGRLYLSSAAPDIVEFAVAPPIEPAEIPSDVGFDLENGIEVRTATVEEGPGQGQLHVIIYWEVVGPVSGDYSVAVHLVSVDPPQGREDILDQADSTHPVENWYPTSQWSIGEVVRDDHVLDVPSDSSPVAVRIAMYQVDGSGAFVNTEWLSLAIPE